LDTYLGGPRKLLSNVMYSMAEISQTIDESETPSLISTNVEYLYERFSNVYIF